MNRPLAPSRPLGFALALLFSLLLSACGAVPTPDASTPPGELSPTVVTPTNSAPTTPSPKTTDPVEPKNYPPINFLLQFDSILPIYEPEFVGAEDAPLQEEELIIGFSIDGAAKAYPITVLRFREMVNDELAGTPILVSW